jgi:hypothetical protein
LKTTLPCGFLDLNTQCMSSSLYIERSVTGTVGWADKFQRNIKR